VDLVDLRDDPIVEITERGIRTESGEHLLDMLIFATGFDAITGAMQNLNPRGRNGIELADYWSDRFRTYLGMAIPGFPNLFMVHGPESPCVLFNMPLGAEIEVDWIRDCIDHLRRNGLGTIEPRDGIDQSWAREVADAANQTLYPLTDSWYTGSNIPGKHRQFAVHVGGPEYFARLDAVAAAGYDGFVMQAAHAADTSAG
jgi:cyclohexanone monooxygenase